MQPSTASEMKRELNLRFKESHPGVDSTITLSQIRELKKIMVKIGVLQDVEPSSVAFAFVYFEKLILSNFVNKSNKRLIAAVCLLLAVKTNDPKETSYAKLLEVFVINQVMERELEIYAKEVHGIEFSVYCALDFSLFIPLSEIEPHLDRVYREIDLLDSH